MLKDLLTEDHRHCDDILGGAETAVQRRDWSLALGEFANFMTAMERHFDVEETQLFPAFEEATGIVRGPTSMMRMEHSQMRALMKQAEAALLAGDQDDYLGQVETLIIMMQQHNMKEENVLYPMCDQHLADQSERLSAGIRGALTIA